MKRVILTGVIASLSGIAAVNQWQDSPSAAGESATTMLASATPAVPTGLEATEPTEAATERREARKLPQLVDPDADADPQAPTDEQPSAPRTEHAVPTSATALAPIDGRSATPAVSKNESPESSQEDEPRAEPNRGLESPEPQAYVAILLQDLEWRIAREREERGDTEPVAEQQDVQLATALESGSPAATQPQEPPAKRQEAEAVAVEADSARLPTVAKQDPSAESDSSRQPKKTEAAQRLDQLLKEIEALQEKLQQEQSGVAGSLTTSADDTATQSSRE